MTKQTSTSPLIIFVHIPKTAGMSMTRVLENQYGAHAVLDVIGEPASRESDESQFISDAMGKLNGVSGRERNQIRVVSGHCYFGVHKMLSQPAVYFTILREPIQRIVSMYHHLLRKPSHPLHAKIFDENWTLERFVASDISHELSNDQVRRISGLKAEEVVSNPQGALELAKTNIQNHFLVAGLTERFDETLLLLAKQFNWRTPYHISRNVARPSSKRTPFHPALPSPRILQAIRNRNVLDIEFYEWTSKRFDEEVRNLGVTFQDQLKRFQSLNRLYPVVHITKRFIGTSVQEVTSRITNIKRQVLGANSP